MDEKNRLLDNYQCIDLLTFIPKLSKMRTDMSNHCIKFQYAFNWNCK